MGVSTSAVSDGLLVGSATPVVLANVNENRDTIIIHNAAHVLYVKCGNTVSDTDFTYRLTKNTTLELTGFVGKLVGISSANYTFVRVTELI